MKKLILALAATLAVGGAFATGVQMKHTVTLKPGWNAFYLPISLTNSASEVFADWPVDSVGFYDQTAFAFTRQFSTGAADTTEGSVIPGMKLWVKGDLGHSSFDTLIANGVYVTVNTNRTDFTAELYGEPVAYRVAWHVSDGETKPVNFAGISSSQDVKLTADGYFNGLTTDWTNRYLVYGLPTSKIPLLNLIVKTPTLANGGVVAMDAKKISDWSGVLNVSPSAGITLGTNYNSSVVSIRNDAFETRRVRVSFREGQWPRVKADEPSPLVLPVPTVMYLDSNVHTNWQASLRQVPYERELLPGETLKLRVAVDREKELLDPNVGTEYGGIIDVEDISSERPSYFKTSIPFSAESDGGAFWRTKWPKGLWVMNVKLDKVSRMIAQENVEMYEDEVVEKHYIVDRILTDEDGVTTTNQEEKVTIVTNLVPVLATKPIPVVKPMELRLLMHVDANGAMNLMERARLGGRRLSAPVLPTDTPILPGSGKFGANAVFDWTVAETSKVNPFRHAKHPDHDGKSFDFKGPAPSGDDFENYSQVVKPELFSIMNKLSLDWNATTGTGWSPEEFLSGSCAWNLKGLRREGTIFMTGSFTMHRLSDDELNDLKD